ncbi:hypothetical protein [Peribacillus simplex]
MSGELILLRMVSYLEEVSRKLQDGLYGRNIKFMFQGDQSVDEKTA